MQILFFEFVHVAKMSILTLVVQKYLQKNFFISESHVNHNHKWLWQALIYDSEIKMLLVFNRWLFQFLDSSVFLEMLVECWQHFQLTFYDWKKYLWELGFALQAGNSKAHIINNQLMIIQNVDESCLALDSRDVHWGGYPAMTHCAWCMCEIRKLLENVPLQT